jgi:hypothetical protein
LNPAREPDGWGNRRRIMVAAPELNLLVCESYINPTEKVNGVDREQQIWTYRYAKADAPVVAPPANVRVITDNRSAMVEFDRSPVAKVEKYLIERGEGPTPWQAEFREENFQNGDNKEFRHRDQDPGDKPVYYRVRAITADGTKSEWSPVVRSQPRVPDDLAASVINTNEVQLWWKPVPLAVSYHVERAPVEVLTEDQLVRLKKDTDPLAEPSVGAIKSIGKFERITKEPVKQTAFTDRAIDLTKLTKVEGEATFTHRFGKEQIDDKGKGYRFGVYGTRPVDHVWVCKGKWLADPCRSASGELMFGSVMV